MKVININIRINDLSQTGVDWDDEDEVHMFLHYLIKDLRQVCMTNIPIDKESVKIDAVVADKIDYFVCDCCGVLKSKKEGEECYSCSHPIDGEY